MTSSVLHAGEPAASSLAPRGGRLARGERTRANHAGWLYVPAAVFMIAIFFVPLGIMVKYSFTDPTTSLQNYRDIASSSIYLRVLEITLKVSLYSSIVSLIVAYPYAYLMSRSRPAIAGLLGLISVFPYLTSTVVRAFSWIAILGPNGPIPAALRGIGIARPPELLGNTFAVVIGIVQTQLPFVVLPIYAALVAVRPEYLLAAASLGASSWRTFLRVTLPLSRQGIVVGFLLAFVYALGAYVTPALLGGRGTLLVGPAIQYEVQETLGFGVASTMGVLVMVVSILLIALAVKVSGIRGVTGS